MHKVQAVNHQEYQIKSDMLGIIMQQWHENNCEELINIGLEARKEAEKEETQIEMR
jgi:hypothetical protein